MLSYFCYILWSLDFNSFLLTKPSSKLSRKRKRKEDKQEAKRKKELEFFLYEELFPYETLCTSVGREVLGGAWCSCVSFLSHLMRVSEKSKKFETTTIPFVWLHKQWTVPCVCLIALTELWILIDSHNILSKYNLMVLCSGQNRCILVRFNLQSKF